MRELESIVGYKHIEINYYSTEFRYQDCPLHIYIYKSTLYVMLYVSQIYKIIRVSEEKFRTLSRGNKQVTVNYIIS
jgi:hypothetical protein